MIAHRVAARYPEIPVRFLSTGEPAYINAKVSSMEVMGAAAAHDIFVISDSDVHVAPTYLRDIAQPFADPSIGALTCLYRGEASEGIWAQLEASGMSIEMSAGVLVANMLEGMHFLLGPTMVTRRACVEAIGGFATLGRYCADDFVLGKLVAAQGYRIVLSRHVIDHVILSQEFLDSQKHQIRWMRSTRFSRPKGHLGTSLTFAIPFGMLGFFAAAALHHPMLAWKLLAFAIASRLLMALVVGIAAVEERSLLRTVALFPIRDLLGFTYWAASYWSDVILWRGRHFRLCKDGLMEAVSVECADTEPAVSARI
jgi:ceramide glucosyltransferase